MRENLQDLVERVSAEDWNRYLPAPSTVRGKSRKLAPRRTLAIVGAAAVAAAAVVIPTAIAHRVDSVDRPRPAASGTVVAGQPSPCKTEASSPRKAADVVSALLKPADAVPRFRETQQIIYPYLVDFAPMLNGYSLAGLKAGQQGAALSGMARRRRTRRGSSSIP